MGKLKIRLFGVPQIWQDDVPVAKKALSKKKASAILFYLAVDRNQANRDHLAGLLWADQIQSKARANVRGRSGLSHLRNLFPDHVESGDVAYLKGDFEVDAGQFETNVSGIEPTIAQLQAGVALYTGSFLEQVYVEGEGAEGFNAWVDFQRERYRTAAINALQQLIIYHTDWQEYELALRYVEQSLLIEDWTEWAHRYKMRLLAYKGQRGEALKQYERCRELLNENLATEPGIETRTLYEDIRAQRLEPPRPIPFAVPPRPQRFIGRKSLIQALTKQLQPRPNALPIVALAGMGGIGKTTLATEMAHQLSRSFKDGVLWGNVSESRPKDIIASWVLLYGRDVSGQSDIKSRQVVWNAVAAQRTILIVLDGVESVESVEAARLLLPSSRNCVVLLTTRNRDSAESLRAQIINVPVFSQNESLDLLCSIVHEAVAVPTDVWSLDEIDSAETICRLIDHLPLAIEIIGHRLRTRRRLSLANVAQQLEQHLSRLDELKFSDKAVRASFELSWDLLDERHRILFATLSIFEGQPFTVEAAAQIVGLASHVMVAQLDELIALSLLQEVDADHQKQHALLAEFAAEKVQMLQLDQVKLTERFAHYYYQFTQENQDKHEQFLHAWGNIQRALNIAYSHKNWSQLCAHTKLMVAIWEKNGRFYEAQTAYALGRVAVQKLEDVATEAYFLERWAFSLLEQSNIDASEAYLDDSLALYQTLNNEEGISDVQMLFGRIHIEKSNYEEAHQQLMDALQVKQRLNDYIGQGKLLRMLGWLNVRNTIYNTAEDFINQAREIQVVHDPAGYSDSTRYLASINMYRREYEQALPYAKQALRLFRDLDNKPELAISLYTIAALYVRLKQYDEAQHHAREALDLFHQMGNVKFEALTAREQGLIALNQRLFDVAIHAFLHAERLLRLLNDNRNLMFILENLGDIYLELKKPKKVKIAWDEALQLAKNERLLEQAGVIASKLADLAD